MHGISPQNNLSTPHSQATSYAPTAATAPLGQMRPSLHSTLGNPSVSKSKRKARPKTTASAFLQTRHSHFYLEAPTSRSHPGEMDTISQFYPRQGFQQHQLLRSTSQFRQRNSSSVPQPSSTPRPHQYEPHPSLTPPSVSLEHTTAVQHDTPCSSTTADVEVEVTTTYASRGSMSPFEPRAAEAVPQSEPSVHTDNTEKSLTPAVLPRRNVKDSTVHHLPTETSSHDAIVSNTQQTKNSSTATTTAVTAPDAEESRYPLTMGRAKYVQNPLPSSQTPYYHQRQHQYLRQHSDKIRYGRYPPYEAANSPRSSPRGYPRVHPIDRMIHHDADQGKDDLSKYAVSTARPEYRSNEQTGSPMLTKSAPVSNLGPNPSEVRFRSYSGHVPELRQCFQALQERDQGSVEQRTIAFSANLTISRWEPSERSAGPTVSLTSSAEAPNSRYTATRASSSDVDHAAIPSSSSSSVSHVHTPGQHVPPQPTASPSPSSTPRNPKVDPVYAARFISLANYIRHIVVLTSSPRASPQQQQQQARQQQAIQSSASILKSAPTKQDSSNDHRRLSNSPLTPGYRVSELTTPHSATSSSTSPTSLTTNTSATSTTTVGPIKTDASRKYYRRISSEYQDHAMRRQLYHHRQHVAVEPDIQEGDKDKETLHVAEALEQLRESSARTVEDQATTTATGGDEAAETLSWTSSSQYGSPIQLRRAQNKPPLTISTDFKAGGGGATGSTTTTSSSATAISNATATASHPSKMTTTPSTATAISPPYHQASIKSADLPTVLSIPFPNLTLTLALIYVDRLKSKYPEARGETGCSHRLFLVAYIIAAKYRCSVELAHLASQLKEMEIEQELELERQQEQRRQQRSQRSRDDGNEEEEECESDERSSRMNKKPRLDQPVKEENGAEPMDVYERRQTSVPLSTTARTISEEWTARRTAMEKRLEQAEKLADLVFSNHAWTRLLNFGIFSLSPPATPANVPANTPGAAASTPSTTATTTTTTTTPMQSSLTTNMPNSITSTNTNGASSATVLQVEDLDRMEVEFLTFLNCDLSALSHDLQTCWNLLVGV
ncbi:hypothetical protein BGZ73_002290 [Actinomortierella ambigua]|nr:hypothetical protein BGZ73_002290 [Actinomortierella ambigua]